ncbi:MAG: SufE family protein [Leptolyngbya sp. IPPAS B-1204]|uniref:SufE family protein n=1 Tax=Leptolyngbya sp. NK1-12 TaxID=2547451 RepID=A0AA97AIV5_9CYAN|nr:SufE family protein [Leptolyngbya sp. NK1-12]MBF2049507.1 SufE family protein [Elainella sp. C42_A2020_010]RNJ68343.1 MAG: SufE family protein [Leptolyngbya sp. IPPAS B-1204]WNZ24241.1 SufE family protein [Leptolyngbya sp. NK1-12]
MVGTSSPLPPALAQIVQRFQRVSDPKQRYEQLISLAKRLDPLPEAAKIPENKVSGCVSQVYITADLVDGKVKYQGDSDSQLVKGLVALLIKGLDGLPPEEILQVTPDFIQATGLNVSLTPSRANGFYNIFRMMQQKAYQLQGAAS